MVTYLLLFPGNREEREVSCPEGSKVGKYLRRKILIYLLTFFVAVTIDWLIPRFMPGNPVQNMLARAWLRAEAIEVLRGYYIKAFGLDVPLWRQYLNFWLALFHGDLDISAYFFPKPVLQVIMGAVPYDVFLLVPAILLSWIAGNKFGAFAARRKWLDSTLLPLGYILTATPYMWLGILMVWFFGVVLGLFPVAGAYSYDLVPHFSLRFVGNLLGHWILPFGSLFIVMFGGWGYRDA